MDLVSGTRHKLTSDCNRVVLSPLPAPLLFLLDVLHADFGVLSCLLTVILLIRLSSLDTAVFFMALSLESPLLLFSVHLPETVQEPTWFGLYLVKSSVHSCVCNYSPCKWKQLIRLFCFSLVIVYSDAQTRPP